MPVFRRTQDSLSYLQSTKIKNRCQLFGELIYGGLGFSG